MAVYIANLHDSFLYSNVKLVYRDHDESYGSWIISNT